MNWNIQTLSNILLQSVHEFWKYCHLSINSRGFDQSITYFCIPAISPWIEIYWYCSHDKSMHWNILALVHMFSRFVRGIYCCLTIYSSNLPVNWSILTLANIFPWSVFELKHTNTCQYIPTDTPWIGTYLYLPIHSRGQSLNWNILILPNILL